MMLLRWLINVNMRHNYVDMHHNYVIIWEHYVNVLHVNIYMLLAADL